MLQQTVILDYTLLHTLGDVFFKHLFMHLSLMSFCTTIVLQIVLEPLLAAMKLEAGSGTQIVIQ